MAGDEEKSGDSTGDEGGVSLSERQWNLRVLYERCNCVDFMRYGNFGSRVNQMIFDPI